MIWIAILAVAQPLLGPPMPDKSKVMTQKKKRYHSPLGCELGVGLTTHSVKICNVFVEKLLKLETGPKQRRGANMNLRVGT